MGVPRFYKLTFLSYDGKDDPLSWLNKCEHFFRAQRTPAADRVWLASFHMMDTAQHWYYMLERDVGDINAISWDQFAALCQQRFGPLLGTNHLADLARLPYKGSVEDYQVAFQARMAHAGCLSPGQQVQLFTGGLPEPIFTDVELQGPQDLQHAMMLARRTSAARLLRLLHRRLGHHAPGPCRGAHTAGILHNAHAPFVDHTADTCPSARATTSVSPTLAYRDGGTATTGPLL